MLPPSLEEWLPADHLARFVAELVEEHLDLSRILAAFTEGRGGPPYDPRLMVRLMIYGYCAVVAQAGGRLRRCGRVPITIIVEAIGSVELQSRAAVVDQLKELTGAVLAVADNAWLRRHAT